MFSFSKASILIFIAAGTLQAAETNYPVTSSEVAGIKNLGQGINTPDSEYTPFITPDEKYLFFQSNREPSAGPEGDFDLWYSKNSAKNRGTDEPVFDIAANVGLPVNSESLDGHPTLRKLANGEHEMYFSSFASSKRLGPALTNIYYTVWRGGKWLEPVPVAELNTDFHDRMPSISEDGRYLFFSSDRPGGKGGDDIWISEMDPVTNKWGAPKNAGLINTAASEVTPAIHSDGTTLYFSSNHAGGVGGYDIYFTQSLSRLTDPESADILTGGWSNPLNLGKPFNSEFDDEYPTVIASGERVYFTSNRPEGHGSFDVYRAAVPLFARPVMRLSLKGRTLSGAGSKIVPSKITITSGNYRILAETVAERKGAYGVNFASQKQYDIVIEAQGYRTAKDILDARNIRQSQTIEKDFRLIRDIRLPKILRLNIGITDAEGRPVSPQTKFRLSPAAKKFSTLKISKGKGALEVIRVSDFKSEEEAISVLDSYVLEVQAKKKGLPSLDATKSLSEILDEYQGAVPETVNVKFVMGEKTANVQKPVAAEPAEKPAKEEPAEKPKGQTKTGLKFLGRIYFATDVHDKMLGNDEAFLKGVAARLKKSPRQKLVLIGHGDSRGTQPYNKRLGRQRAEFVKKQLIAKGVPAKRIVIRSAGKNRRRYANDSTAVKRQKNRRADIFITVAVIEEDDKPKTDKEESAAPADAANKEEAPAALEPKPEPATEEKPEASEN